jgi:glycosyltransferase involved in cell wall biosynthesis
MNIVQITPGAGGMYCGVCVRDNALVAALKKLGHRVTMIPLYLPLTLDEKDESADTPIFFSGINVYLEQKSGLFAMAPDWFRNLMASRSLLKWAGGMAGKTRPEELGELTLSMLRGEEGKQVRELDELIGWLKTQPRPDVIFLSNALLMGLARKLRSELGVPIICMFQGEDWFLDALPQPQRAECWKVLAERAKEVERLAAPSRYFAEFMAKRLGLEKGSIRVVANGINLDGFEAGQVKSEDGGQKSEVNEKELRLGYFARMCPEKGLDLLVEAFMDLKKRGTLKNLKLRVGGSCGPTDEPFVKSLRDRLTQGGWRGDVEFFPNVDHAGKIAFLRSLSVLSVPSRAAEAFGLFVIEALAAGVPVVQPNMGAFPELIQETGGGLLYEPGVPRALADQLEALLLKPEEAKAKGNAGKAAVTQKYGSEAMAKAMISVAQEATSARASAQETGNGRRV